MSSAEAKKQAEEKQKQLEAQHAALLDKILSTEAKERLGRIALVKPEKARMVEDLLIQMSQQRNLGGPVQDAELLEILNKVSATEQAHSTVQIKHRGKFDDKWDDDDEGW
ncbi:Double-stranded DNA-binding domain containing protein [Trichomonas vaginalis G3]|uniref:Double-stranded DNA-binding domain containing protein n=1 Tax=Trichomonas vaginalis (strain ATCC PRA-98 / G3) TaxID=412133 RepID=A2FDZ3_TRIV3|nr:regulation of protein import into mitochondrial outer membrane [Trichomonas vaginalis G3]EAX96872.1 Double-stranded DNA-binding domain containing protein [Trichomonas vaginalis G3]KAI5534790.1 regulation of protein import into mitochondrial outer membrane [Trichomonas vaginalis G3]|eukprot:XP_001309802.1 Double-stranded DNA-binding domain containing protein [Trichomonas vaginalis G3]